jgi:glutamate carboxypeptidase
MSLAQYMEEQREEFLKIFKDIVSLESPTHDKKLNDTLADYLQNLFERIAKVERIPQEKCGDNLRIEYGSGSETILLLCHMDTVWDEGEVAKRPFTLEGDKILGPGVYDMKFGIVQAFFTLKALQENNITIPHKIVLYINSDEETGSFFSKEFIRKEASKSKCVIVLEPSEETGFAKTQRKGMVQYELLCHGKSAHAGAFHQDGISAVKELAHQILAIENMTDYEKGITANVGIIQGGTRNNVIPDKARATIDFRFHTQSQGEEISKNLENLVPKVKGAKIETKVLLFTPPFEKNEGNQRLYHFVKKAAETLGIPMGEISAGGLSDGNTTSALGIPTIDGMGAIGLNSHALDEFVQADKINERVLLLIHTLITLNNF